MFESGTYSYYKSIIVIDTKNFCICYQQARITFVLLFRNRKEIENKYCLRGAEWGVGDCSTEGMSPEEREKFIAMLKQKAGEE